MNRIVVLWYVALSALLAGGCTSDLLYNITEERTGNIEVVFINNTPYRASFTCGTFDSLDRNPPGQVALLQQRIEAFTTTAPNVLACRRNFAIATPELLNRIILTDADQGSGFDADVFDATVDFSSAPADSDSAAAPTPPQGGTAAPREFLLGVDYSCADRLIITFQEDANAPGGFRIDYSVILDIDPRDR